MASVIEVMFLLSFLVFVGLWFFKLYDVLTGMSKFSGGVMWLTLVGLFMSYGLSFITLLNGDYTVFYATVFEFETLLYYLVYLFLFIQLFVVIARRGSGEKGAFKSLGDR